ncbi:MAG TPA: exodeoxyribonuclease VII small subunit [Eubacteriales bacterium]|nr:exodeoxyribonuclease VII small subunit [Eubacteriales bacterium]
MEKQLRFEEAMQKLTGIVEKLESGEGSLDEMISLYEEGMQLVKGCEKQLDAYEATITKLNLNAGGEADAD